MQAEKQPKGSKNQSTTLAKRKQYWLSHIEQCKLDNQTYAAYSRQHELNYSQFMYWIRRNKNKDPSSSFIPVKIGTTTKVGIPPLCILEIGANKKLLIYNEEILEFLLERFGI